MYYTLPDTSKYTSTNTHTHTHTKSSDSSICSPENFPKKYFQVFVMWSRRWCHVTSLRSPHLLHLILSASVVHSLSCVRLFGPHALQHARPPCPSLSPGVCSNSYPLNQWCLPTISFSTALFSSCPQSFPASRVISLIGSPLSPETDY